MINPYQPPHFDSFPLKWVRYPMNPWTQVALIATSIAFGVGYQLVQNLRVSSGDPIPIWPHLTIPTLICLAAAVPQNNGTLRNTAYFFGVVTWAANQTWLRMAQFYTRPGCWLPHFFRRTRTRCASLSPMKTLPSAST